MNSDARSLKQIRENSDITQGVGREQYQLAVNRDEMGRNEYRTARNTYLTAVRSNESALNQRAKDLYQESLRIVPLEFTGNPSDASVVYRNRAERASVSTAQQKLINDRKRVDAKYPPV